MWLPIPTINQQQDTMPVKTVLDRINILQKATSHEALEIAKAEACGYLTALKDTRYINQREFFEYSRQLADVYSTHKGVLQQ